MPNPEQIYNNIKGYRGSQLGDWDPVEAQMFNYIANWFGGWMRTNGMADVKTESQATVKGWLQTYEAPNMLAAGAESFSTGPKLGSDLIVGTVNCYTVGTLKKLLGAIHSIGSDERANNRGYLIRFNDNSLVYLCHTTHYAYPIRLANTLLANLNSYKHQYDDLMTSARDTPVNDVIRFINRNVTPTAVPTDLDLLTVFVANYVYESDRNWVQLLVSLILLGTEINLPVGAHPATSRTTLTTFKAKVETLFPMGGGGWKNRCSWGGGANPVKIGGDPSDGNDIKRWFLSILIEITEQVYVGKNGDKILQKENWLAWIEHLKNSGPSNSQLILKHINDILQNAVNAISKVR